ncbi:SRPBCC domain-containing protein [Acidaminobacter sp. JC074]|uniref:SRPBCC domain-containing protein n=1 Tax=Acidaminobacter sp. JC074 TaxID=2530199 RepID=UPI001F0E0962|nr:SRPBCC domain-containing protein [Acidaminobacter sp. JC074]
MNASITQSMRFFLIEKEVAKWLGQATIENKTGGKYLLNLEFEDKRWASDTVLLEKVFESRLKFDMITAEAKLPSSVEFNFMPCTSKTEYCTEIHLIHRNTGEDQDIMSRFWDEKLDKLRKHFNNDWVIEDRDLVLSVLKGGF